MLVKQWKMDFNRGHLILLEKGRSLLAEVGILWLPAPKCQPRASG